MATPGFGFRRGGGRLDASDGEVVFCHVCSYEWPRNERESIQCPACNSEATEIIEPGNDPRALPNITLPSFASLFGAMPPPRPPRDHSGNRPDWADSDPEEEDIEQHVTTGPGNTFVHRTIYGSPAHPPGGGGRNTNRLRMGNPPDDMMLRVANMIFQMGGAGAGTRPSPPPPGSQGNDTRPGQFPGLSTSTTTTVEFRRADGTRRVETLPNTVPSPMDFDSLFSDILNGRPRQPGGATQPPRGPVGFAAVLEQLLGMAANPQSAVHGDAVYSQEALDHIISTLMEAQPQSNAAPPASQTAIQMLEKKKLTAEMIGSEGKGECTICIDDMQQGDDVTVLPCTHWFHGECVTLWLKEHNTCPICRRPIESQSERRERRNTESGANAARPPAEQSQSAAGPSSSPPESPLRNRPSPGGGPGVPRPNLFGMGDGTSFFAATNTQGPDGQDRHSQPYSSFFYMSSYGNGRSSSPPARFSGTEFIPSSAPRETGRRYGTGGQDEEQQSSGRRSPLPSLFSDPGSSRRDNGHNNRENDESQRNSSSGGGGHNPLSWLRDHFGSGRNSRGGSGGANSDRDRDRRWGRP